MELWMCHCKVELRLELELDGWLDEVLLELEHWKAEQGLEVIGMGPWKCYWKVGEEQWSEVWVLTFYPFVSGRSGQWRWYL